MINLSKKIYEIDKVCRENYKSNSIISERDYVSIFLNFIKYPYGPYSKISFGYAQTTPFDMEKNYGIDGIIIFKNKSKLNIGVFEAKRIKSDFDSWQGKKPKVYSRFSNQLKKQTKLNHKIAVWEMFINNDFKNKFYDDLGSTCIKKDIAISHLPTKRLIWKLNDLEIIAEKSYKSNLNKPINIEQIVDEMLNGKFGNSINFEKDGIQLFQENKEIKIPLNYEDKIEISKFLEASGFYSYTFIDFDLLLMYQKGKKS